jgi:hypothetical protein
MPSTSFETLKNPRFKARGFFRHAAALFFDANQATVTVLSMTCRSTL